MLESSRQRLPGRLGRGGVGMKGANDRRHRAEVRESHGTVGNAPRTDVSRTIVMYRDGYRPEAARLAKDLGVKIVGPLDGLRKDDLLGAHVALVLGG